MRDIRIIAKVMFGLLFAGVCLAQELPLEVENPVSVNLFDMAVLSFEQAKVSKKETQKTAYETTVGLFERFIKRYPSSPRIGEARFRLAVAREQSGDTKGALEAFREAVEIPSRFSAAAAWHLAEQYYKEGSYEDASLFYKEAANLDEDVEQRQMAYYKKATADYKSGNKEEMLKTLQDITLDTESPYRERARSMMASEYAASGQNKKALGEYKVLAKSSNKKVASEAILQLATMFYRQGKVEEARPWLEEFFELEELKKWRGVAQLALMRIDFKKEDYEKVVFWNDRGEFTAKSSKKTGQRWFLAAQANLKLGQKREARKVFKELYKKFPDSNYGFEAAFQLMQDAPTENKFFKHCEAFLRSYETKHEGHKYIEHAKLLRAERYYSKGVFKKAALAYAEVDIEGFPVSEGKKILSKQATAHEKGDNYTEARKVWGAFIDAFPKDEKVPVIKMRRASLAYKMGELGLARKEWEVFAKDKNNPEEMRIEAWLKLAAQAQEQKDYGELADVHSELLEEFPKREAEERADSAYIIGWAEYQLENYNELITPIKLARDLASSKYGEKAAELLARSYYLQEDVNGLREELDYARANYPDMEFPHSMLVWLGVRLTSEKRYVEAWPYLKSVLSSLEDKKEAKMVLWKAVREAGLSLDKHEEVVEAFDQLIPAETNKYHKAKMFAERGEALMALKRLVEARATLEAGLKLHPSGELFARLRNRLGDVERKAGNIDQAIGHYVVVIELLGEGATKEYALMQVIKLCEQKGDSKSKQRAARYRTVLKTFQD